MSDQKGEIRIYVACLAGYKNSHLHGCWIDACQDEGAIWNEIREMLKASPIADAEEYAIHDHEGFESAPVEEYTGIPEVCFLAEFIQEHGRLGGKLIEHYNDLEDAMGAIEEFYHGEFRSLVEFAEEWAQEMGHIPDNLQFYIDYESMARDLEIYDVFTIETGFEEVHVFWQH